jgi:CubicO group peptidase (beta-lactamase class C family)
MQHQPPTLGDHLEPLGAQHRTVIQQHGVGLALVALRAAYEEHDIEVRKGPVTGAEMLKRLGTIPLAFQPGTMFHSSIATDVLGLLIERVAGAPFDVVMRRALLDPLGMTDTAWHLPEAKRARIAEASDSDPAKPEMWQSCRILENPSADPTSRPVRGSSRPRRTISASHR